MKMIYDKKGIDFAVNERFKYVEAKPDGTIIGWGFSRRTLESHLHNKEAKVYTINQYCNAMKGDEK